MGSVLRLSGLFMAQIVGGRTRLWVFLGCNARTACVERYQFKVNQQGLSRGQIDFGKVAAEWGSDPNSAF